MFAFPGLVHVGDELREVNGNLITHKRPDEISQILVKETKHHTVSDAVWLFPGDYCGCSGWWRCSDVFWSVPVSRLHHTEDYPSCCGRRQAEGKQGEGSFHTFKLSLFMNLFVSSFWFIFYFFNCCSHLFFFSRTSSYPSTHTPKPLPLPTSQLNALLYTAYIYCILSNHSKTLLLIAGV